MRISAGDRPMTGQTDHTTGRQEATDRTTGRQEATEGQR
jgi:hypothetical protein